MRIKLTFHMDVPIDFTVQGYGAAISYARTMLARIGLRTGVWRIDYEPDEPQRNINCNGPSGAPS